jgi:hypothetical protein
MLWVNSLQGTNVNTYRSGVRVDKPTFDRAMVRDVGDVGEE